MGKLNELQSWQVEHYKSMYNYYKYMTTLSTAAILLLITFLDKLINSPKWNVLIIISIGGFLVTIVFSAIAYRATLKDNARPHEDGSLTNDFFMIISWFSIPTGFIVGMISLSIFIIYNLYKA